MDLPPYEEFEYKVFNSEKTFPRHSSGVQTRQHFVGYAMHNFLQNNRSIMPNHSPNSHRDMFELKESNPTPASTSKECDGGDTLLKGSTLVDVTDSIPVNNAYAALKNSSNFKLIDGTLPCIANKVPLAEDEEIPNNIGSSEEQNDSTKHNDKADKHDDSLSQKDEEEDENSEDDLCVKCLYVTMLCCECTIT